MSLDSLISKMTSNITMHGGRLSRYGYADENFNILSEENAYCYYSVKSHMVAEKEKYYFTTYNGGYIQNPKLILPSEVFNIQIGRANYGDFIRNEFSKEWVQFLLGEDSPWKDLHQFIYNRDIDFCDAVGFIFSTDVFKSHHNLFFNFLIATRTPQEFPANYWSYYHLRHVFHIDARLAAIISTEFTPNTKDFGGPWKRWSPDFHQFGMNSAAMAWRFSTSNPKPSPGLNICNADAVFYEQDANTNMIKSTYNKAEDMIGDFLELIRIQSGETKNEKELLNA